MVFRDRADAGRQLAQRLMTLAGGDDLMVLGIPRGGVPVAYEVAKALHAPLDIFLSRKLGVPGHEELAFGAVAAGDGMFLDEEIIRGVGVSEEQITRIAAQVRQELERRAQLYRGGRPPLDVRGKTVILVDDGVATGASLYAAVQALRQMGPATLVVAVPVASQSACGRMEREADLLVAVQTPRDFYSVGQFYREFGQTPDEEVIGLLGESVKSGQ